MVLADSHRISRVRSYLGTASRPLAVSSTGVPPSTPSHSPRLRLPQAHTSTIRQNHPTRPTTPHTQPLPGITRTWFSLFRVRSPLLTESLLFSLPTGTEMFHFPAFPPHHLYIQWQVPGHHAWWVSPFGHPRITGRLSPPRGLSQTPTSFVGSSCPGIHRVPLKTYGNTKKLYDWQNIALQRCSRPLCSSQTTLPHPPPHPHRGPAARGHYQKKPTTHTGAARAPSKPNSVLPPEPDAPHHLSPPFTQQYSAPENTQQAPIH